MVTDSIVSANYDNYMKYYINLCTCMYSIMESAFSEFLCSCTVDKMLWPVTFRSWAIFN